MDQQVAESTPKLGFGLMRLPRKMGRIDIAQVEQMVDLFLESGFTYFDTAHVYVGSEEAAGKALVGRHPRESYTLASKLFATVSPTAASAHKQLATTLKKTGVGYLDYYLLHSITRGNYQKYERFGLWDWAQRQKDAGTIRNVGFSFHSDPELLDQLLTEHPEVDFVQLQLNYADWESNRIASRANYEVAHKHGKPIVVMEPVKGGKLANPPRAAQNLMRAANPRASFASWAIRYVASLPGILTVLSGMSDLDQVRDNVSYMRDFQPLDEDERRVIHQVQAIMGAQDLVPCTRCGYCFAGCPQQIPISSVFDAYNLRLDSQPDEAQEAYRRLLAESGGKGPADCVACGKCEQVCTQGIDVVAQLARAREAFEPDKA